MHPNPTWAIYRDAKTGQLIRKYIAAGNTKTAKPGEAQLKSSRA